MIADTSPAVVARLHELYNRLPGHRRLEMGCGMFDDAKRLAIAGILAETPEINPGELRKRLFLRLFAGDFPRQKIRRILCHLLLRVTD
ncbi:MAG: hypothetical protein ABIG11_09745 [bacterium]